MREKEEIIVRAAYIGERIDVRAISAANRIASNPAVFTAGEAGVVVIFRYGVMVSFSLREPEEKAFIEEISHHITLPFEEPETDELKLVLQPGEAEGMQGVEFYIKSIETERLQLVAEVLSRSVVLAHYEGEVANSFDSIDPMAISLTRRFSPFPRMREPIRQIGRSLLSLHKMVGRVAVTEKPDILWDQPELEKLYLILEDEYEIGDRNAALERKLDLISRTSETVLDLLQTKQTIRVEWYIVILIVIEIFLTLYELFFAAPH